MTIEERLTRSLHAALDTARPSPLLAERIVERVVPGPGRASRPILRPRMAIFAALFAVVVVAGLLVELRSNVPEPGASAGGLSHHDRFGLAYDYPARWSVTDPPAGGWTILGTSGQNDCAASTAAPVDTQCFGDVVGPGEVDVEISKTFAGAPFALIDPTDPSGLGPGERYVTVAGLPATVEEAGPSGSDVGSTLDWQLSVPGQLYYRFTIHAEFKEPGGAQLRAEVEALVASIRYDPPPAVLKAADGPGIAAAWLSRKGGTDPAYACFPTVPGAAATASVTHVAFRSVLTKPLPVTCRTAVEPVALGLWRVTLTESWTTAADRSAGSVVTIAWLDADGTEETVQPAAGPAFPSLPPVPYEP